MTTGTGWLDAVIAVLGVLGFGGLVGAVAQKRVRPVVTTVELITDLQQERDADRAERAVDRQRIDRLEHNQRLTLDYVHALRQDIVDQKPPPPRPWPEGLKP